MKNKRFSLLAIFMVLLTALLLVGCVENGTSDTDAVAEAKTALQVAFTDPDTASSVTKNVTLPAKQGEVTVTWTSDNAAITTAGVVTRGAEDVVVTLTATLVKGSATDTKKFELTVIAEELNNVAKNALLEHYKDTLANTQGFSTKENVELITEIADSTVTWTVVAGGDFFTNEGVVTRPTFTQGDQAIQLKADLSEGSTHTFFFLVTKLDQTVEEKITVALDFVTIKPSTPSGYQEINFAATKKVTIDEKEIDVVWTTSDETTMTIDGELVAFETPDEKTVTLTASITYEGVTLTKSVEFKVKKVTILTSFEDAFPLNGSTVGTTVKVSKVKYFDEDADGNYFLIAEDGTIAYVYSKWVEANDKDKVYDITGKIDAYYSAYQLTNPVLSNPRDVEFTAAEHEDLTLEEVTAWTLPGNAAHFSPVVINLTGVKVRVDDKSDNYKTFLVNQDLADGTTLTNKNSLMVYYKSDLDVIKNLDGKKIDSIQVIMVGYRTNNVVWYFDFFGTADDIEFTPLDVREEAEIAIKAALPEYILEDGTLAVMTQEFDDVTVAWASDNAAITAAGVVTLPAARTEVTLTATIKAEGQPDIVVTHKVLVGLQVIDVNAFKTSEGWQLIKVVVTGISANQTTGLQDLTGAVGSFRLANTFVIGNEYTIIAKIGDNNGLLQAGSVNLVTDHGVATTIITSNDLSNEETIDDDFAADKQSEMFKFTDLSITKVEVDSFGNIVFTATNAKGQVVVVKWDSRIGLDEEIEAELSLVEVGDVLDLDKLFLFWNSGNDPKHIFHFTSDSVFAWGAMTDSQLVNKDKDALDLVVRVTGATDIDFATEGEFGSTITWSFKELEDTNNALVNLVTGSVSLPESGVVTVVVVATLTKGVETATKEFSIVIGVGEDVPPVGGSFVETFDASNATASYADGTFTGVNGVDWTYVHSRDQHDTPIDGKGIMLRGDTEKGLSSLSATFTNGIGEFSFEYRKAFTGGKPRTYAVDVTHNGTTTTYDLPEFGEGSGAQETIYVFTKALNLSGTVTIKIYHATASAQATFDNFAWTELPE